MSIDPFTDASAQDAASLSQPAPRLTTQTSNSSLRAVTGNAANTRARPGRELFPPAASRRAPSRAQRRVVEDNVLADPETDSPPIGSSTNTRLKRVGRMSPDARQARSKQKQEEECDIVYRHSDGSFLRDIPGETEALKEHLSTQEFLDEAAIKSIDDEYVAIARQYFTGGASSNHGRVSKPEEDFDDLAIPALTSLRAQVLQKLEDERWRFEPTGS